MLLAQDKETLSSITALGFGKTNIIDACMHSIFNEKLVGGPIPGAIAIGTSGADTLVCMCDKDPNGTHRKCYNTFAMLK